MRKQKKYIQGKIKKSYILSVFFGTLLYAILAVVVMFGINIFVGQFLIVALVIVLLLAISGRHISKARYITFSIVYIIPLIILAIFTDSVVFFDGINMGDGKSYYTICPICKSKTTANGVCTVCNSEKDICKKCGAKLDGSEKFCKICGEKIELNNNK